MGLTLIWYILLCVFWLGLNFAELAHSKVCAQRTIAVWWNLRATTCKSDWNERGSHLKANVTSFTAQASQHEEDKGKESRERDSHHSQRGRPGQLTQWSAICRTDTTLHKLNNCYHNTEWGSMNTHTVLHTSTLCFEYSYLCS